VHGEGGYKKARREEVKWFSISKTTKTKKVWKEKKMKKRGKGGKTTSGHSPKYPTTRRKKDGPRGQKEAKNPRPILFIPLGPRDSSQRRKIRKTRKGEERKAYIWGVQECPLNLGAKEKNAKKKGKQGKFWGKGGRSD